MTRDDFEYWLFAMDDELASFFEDLADIRARLDYSLESLTVVEQTLLDRYPSPAALLADHPTELDRFARYVGEVVRRSAGGKWNIELDDEQDAFFRLPVIRHEKVGSVCPVALVTASLNRRAGNYLSRVALARVKRRRADADQGDA